MFVNGGSNKGLKTIDKGSTIKKTVEGLQDVQNIGRININIFESEFGKLQTDKVILTNERELHIIERHPQDYLFFKKHGYEVVNNPDIIMVDSKHESTVFLIRKLPEINLSVVLRLALEMDNKKLKNSIMTFHRVRNSNLNKMLKKNKVLYKRE